MGKQRYCRAIRQLKARISKLQTWLKDEVANTEPPTLADVIENILMRRQQSGRASVYSLKAAANVLNFLTVNGIKDMVGLDEKLQAMIEKQFDIRDKLKPIDRRLKTLDEHIKQADIYLTHKGKTARTEAEQVLFTAASNYLKGVMNGKTTLPTKAWKAERVKLTAERKQLDRDYYTLKDEVKEAEQIRRSVYSILRQEQREQQPRRAQDMEL